MKVHAYYIDIDLSIEYMMYMFVCFETSRCWRNAPAKWWEAVTGCSSLASIFLTFFFGSSFTHEPSFYSKADSARGRKLNHEPNYLRTFAAGFCALQPLFDCEEGGRFAGDPSVRIGFMQLFG